MGLGVISGTTAYRPPQPSYMVGNGLHSVLGRFKVGLGWFVNAYYSHSMNKVKQSSSQSQGGHLWIQRGLIMGSKGVGTHDAKGRFYNRTEWDHGSGHVGLRSSLGLVLSYVGLVLGNEVGGSHHMQGCHTWGLGIGSRKLVVLTLNIHQIFN